MNFISDFFNKKVEFDSIDQYIENWHDSNSTLPLHTYLGLTKEEYILYIEHPDELLNNLNKLRDEKNN